MTKAIFLILALLAGEASAAICTTNAGTGTWNTASTWSCGHVPVAADTVVISRNITLDANRTVAGLTVNAGAVLNGNNRNLTVNGAVSISGTYNTNGGNLTTTGGGALSINTGGAFNFTNGNAAINGNVVINGTLSSGGDAIQMTGASTTLSGTGNVVDTTIEIDATGVSVPAGANLKFDANSEIDVAANVSPASLTVNGTIDGTAQAAGDRIIRVSTGGSLTVGSTGVINAPNSRLDVRDGASASNNGTITIGDLRGRTGTPVPVFTQGANSTLNVSGVLCAAANPCTFNASAAGNTVNYNGAAQTVKVPSGSNYANLTLSGSGAKTMPTGLTVAGDFTMSGTATTTAPAALAVGGDFIIGTNNTFTPGSGTVTLNGASAQTIGGGTTDLSLFNLTVSNTAGITLARNVIVTGTLTGTVTLTSTCPADYMLTSNGGATVQHSCPVSGPHHIRVQHDGNGLTCTPAILTVIACANAACTGPNYTSALTGNVTWTGAPGGSVAFNITAGGTTTVSLPVTTVQTVTLGTSAVSPPPANPGDCWNTATATASCSLPFADSGLLVNAPNHVAETAQNMAISAVRKSNNALNCVPAFANVSRAVNLKCTYTNPTTGTLPVRVAGVALNAANNAVAACDTTGQSPALAFDASGVATTMLQYADVGQMTLNATYTGSVGTGDGGLVMTGSGSFIAKPDHFDLTAIQQTAAPSLANPAAADAAGAKFIKAGEAFSVRVSAKNFANAATPNFGKEASPESVKLTSVLVAGLGLANNPVIGGTFGMFTNGEATGTAFTWNEVGIIRLTPGVGDGDYLGMGDVLGTQTGNVGRFYAAKFALSGGVIANRTGLAGCAAPAGCGAFTYIGEPMSAVFSLIAKAEDGTTTLLNYNWSATTANQFAKLDPLAAVASGTAGPLGVGAVDSAATRTPFLPCGATPAHPCLVPAQATSGTFASGVASVIVPLTVYRDNAAAAGPYAALDIGIAPQDSDGAAIAAYDLDTVNVVAGANNHAKVGRTEMRYGRMKLSNAHGSELLPLPISVTAQYWNGATYVTNALDSHSSFAASDVIFSNPQKNLAIGETSVVTPPAAVVFSGGVAGYQLARPGGGDGKYDGSLDMTVNIIAAYLPSNTARATFGVYKGNNEFIYLRESY